MGTGNPHVMTNFLSSVWNNKKPQQPPRWYLASRKRKRRGTCRSSFTSFCLSFPTNAQPFLRGYTQEKREYKTVSFSFTRDKKDKIGTLSFRDVRVAWESQKPPNSSVNCHPLGWKFFPSSAPNFVRWVPLCLFVELLSCLNKIWRAESRWRQIKDQLISIFSFLKLFFKTNCGSAESKS